MPPSRQRSAASSVSGEALQPILLESPIESILLRCIIPEKRYQIQRILPDFSMPEVRPFSLAFADRGSRGKSAQKRRNPWRRQCQAYLCYTMYGFDPANIQGRLV